MIGRFRSLQGRLLFLLLTAVITVWAVSVALAWQLVRQRVDLLLDSHLSQAAALLVIQQGSELIDGDLDLELPQAPAGMPPVAFQVFREGQLLMQSAGLQRWPLLPSELPREGFSTLQHEGRQWRVFGAMGREHHLQVYVAEQVAARLAIADVVLESMAWPMLLALPLLALAIAWGVRRSFQPLHGLGETLAHRPPQDLTPLPLPPAARELQPVIAALNGLLARIAQMVEAERRFIADAAHELLTPIAGIRAQAQVAQGASTFDATGHQHALQQTLAGCDRAVQLVRQLLMLSRVEGDAAPEPVAVDLAALVRRVSTEIATRALQKDQAVELEAEGQVVVQGDATLLEVLVRNLGDNAVRYSPAGARIHIALTAHDGGAVLQVDDSGPGLAPEDLVRLGERFFRVLGSGQDGSGLGFSIVRRIAEVHGATVAVLPSRALGGLCVRVCW